jgi:multiple sugar transport system substrate-binding protein
MRKLMLSALALMLATPALAQQTQITIWTRLAEEANKPLFDAFEAANPDIDIVVEYIPGGKNHVNKLVAAAAAGATPDMTVLDVVATEQFARLGVLKPLDEIVAGDPLLSGDLFPQGPLQTSFYDGKQYAIPYGGDASAVVYNKAYYTERGLDPENPPKTWAEFVDAAKKLTFDRDGDGKNDVYGMLIVPSQPWLATFYWLPYFWMAGGEFNDREKLQFTFNSEAGVKSLSYFMDMHLVAGVVPPDAIGAAAANDNDLQFLQGRIAMEMAGPGILARRDRDAPDFQLGVMRHPTPNAGETSVSFAGGDNLAILNSIDEAKMPAAIRVLQWMASVEGQRNWFTTKARIPVRKELLTDPFYDENPLAKVFLEAFLDAHEPPRTNHYTEVQQYLRDAFEQTAFGAMTA